MLWRVFTQSCPHRGLSHLTVALCHKQEPGVDTACRRMSGHFMSHVWIM